MTETSSEIGNLMILASAGSGKTYQLVNRVIRLVACGIPPTEIVALTFTRKAAGEFADAVLTRLAEAASDEGKAEGLRRELGVADADFQQMLEQVTQALPQWMLGTIDSFFTRVLRAFQHELGLVGNQFELLQGPRAEMVADRLLDRALTGTGDREIDGEFEIAFRRATMGREEVRIQKPLRDFVNLWQECFSGQRDREWGPAALCALDVGEWEKRKHALAAAARQGLGEVHWTRKGQDEALENLIATIENHTIGSGSIAKNTSGMWTALLEDVAGGGDGPMELQYHKTFSLPAPVAGKLRDLLRLCARCELAAAGQRTKAIERVMERYDAMAEKEVRSKGLLGFQDVKVLMGRWAHGEEDRLRREAVDYRLGARYRHWLLDEFQDTSRADWLGLSTLVEEALVDEEGSGFLVGDKKQAIYAWRGGDVSLFDEIYRKFSRKMERRPMADSYRSCPEVLELVNRVCGDGQTIRCLFGEVADDWEWQDHESAPHLRTPDRAGDSRVESVAGEEEKRERMLEILQECRAGEASVTCAVLVRQNSTAREMADFLREHGFDVVLDGTVRPATDSPQGWLVLQTLRWLADPSDSLARGVLEMSPPGRAEWERCGRSWQAVWTSLADRVSAIGYADAMRDWLEPFLPEWSAFGRERFAMLVESLEELDRQKVIPAWEAADWLERMECPQAPSAAAVQVMTIHKSKGLGFDLVILPEVSNDSIPAAQRFDIAETEEWLLQAPPQWVRLLVPELRQAEDRWARQQRYEAMCLLYVALTRAKRGLHVLLDHLPQKPDLEKPSLANWIRTSLGASGEGELFRCGDPGWSHGLDPIAAAPGKEDVLVLGETVRRPAHRRPSEIAKDMPVDADAMAYGNEVHCLLQSIVWLDEGEPALPDTPAGEAVRKLLATGSLEPVFFRRGRSIECHTEQAVDARTGDGILSGIMDRLLIHRDGQGGVERVEIIDWKTDAVDDPAQLGEKYSGQMNAYRGALQKLHPHARVEASLVSVRHGVLVPCPGE